MTNSFNSDANSPIASIRQFAISNAFMRLFEIPFLRPRLLTLTVPQTDLPPFIPGTFLSCCFDWVNYIIFNERTVLNIYEDAVILCSKNAFTKTSNTDLIVIVPVSFAFCHIKIRYISNNTLINTWGATD